MGAGWESFAGDGPSQVWSGLELPGPAGEVCTVRSGQVVDVGPIKIPTKKPPNF